jgi:ActR/RegA family two-component response regulator
MQTSNETVLLVEDHEPLARTFATRLSRNFDVVVAHDVETALNEVRNNERFVGALLDYKLPDGNALRIIEALRERDPAVYIVVVTGEPPSVSLVNSIAAKGACFARKSADGFEIADFARNCERRHALAYLRRRGLTKHQVEILAVSLRARSRADAARALGLSDGTMRTTIGRILRKCGAGSLRELAGKLLFQTRSLP